MSTPLWEQAKSAIAAGDADGAIALVDRAVDQWRSLQRYSIDWVASLLSFIGRELGEDAVERSLRRSGDEFITARRSPDWNELPAPVRAKAIARAMVSNFGDVEVSEDDDKIVLSFRCGTGGRLIDESRYDGDDGFLVLTERAPRTFDRDALPVYCAHCSVNNEMQPIEATGYPVTIEHPPSAPGEPCVHHVYKDLGAIPPAVYARVGQRRRVPPAG